MSIAVLGPLTVDGEAGQFGPRDRVVLAALAVRPGDVVSADRLADALWGERRPGTWGKVVQGCIVRLRKILGAGGIETSPQGYRLNISSDDIDSLKFERLLGRGRELLTLAEPERAAYVLGEAMALWRGPPLPELDAWDLGRIEADRLGELYRDVEELSVDAALRAGRSSEILARAQTLVVEAPLRERRWALLALAQYQAGRQTEALRTLRQVRTVLASELALDPGPDLLALERAILQQEPSLVAEAALPEPSATCPYQGLLPYAVRDADSFFGRDADITECLRRLTSYGVLVVVGPSGSGKSSLVGAGVAAALERDGRRVVMVTPGTHPLDALTVVPRSGPTPILVVDQCEEAVTVCTDTTEQARFFRGLATHAEQGGLVVALRADRMGEVSSYPEFARLVERGLYLISALGPEELRACIEGPASQAGLLFEPGLVDLLVREVEGEPGALPLLSHALRETWLQREGRTLTVAGYVATGGIRGAVARSAEDVYERVPPDQRPMMRDLLLRLVAPSLNGDLVRSRMPRRLVAADEPHEKVIEMLVAARLVTSDDGVLQLAHEALARAWPRLKQWLQDDTEGQRILRHLTAAADAWQSMGHPPSELYRGVRLAQALDWSGHTQPDLTLVELSFLDASRAQVDVELSAARRHAEQEAKAGRRTGRLAAGLAAALVLALVAAGVATRFQRTAEVRAGEAAANAADARTATTEADANRIAALSKSVGSLDLSLLLAAEARRIADTPATQDGLLAALIQHRRALQVVQLNGRTTDGELADGGKTLFVALGDKVVAWDVDTNTPLREVVAWDQPKDIAGSPTEDLVALWAWKDDETIQVGVFAGNGKERLHLEGEDEIGGWPSTFGFSPDGRRLLMLVSNEYGDNAGAQGSVREVDIATGKLVRTYLAQRSSRPNVSVYGTFADDGSAAVNWTEESRTKATLVNLDDGTRTRVHVARRPASSLGFVPLPTGVAQRWDDGAVTLYDDHGRRAQVLDVHQAAVNDLVVAPDRSWAASVDNQGAVIVWTVDRATGLWSQRESLVGHDGGVTGIAVDPSGQTLVTVSRDGTAISWDVSAEAGFGAPIAGLGDRWISNRPQTITPGRLIVAPTRPAPTSAGQFLLRGPGTAAVAAVFLDPITGEVVDKVPVGDTIEDVNFGSSVAVSPDGTKVAVTYGLGTVVLDTRTREELARIVLPPTSETAPDGRPRPELVWCAAWTQDGSRLLLGPEGKGFDPADGNLLVVDTASWTLDPRRVDLGGSAQTMEVSPDGSLLAVGMAHPAVSDAPPGSVRILHADTLEVARVLELGESDYPLDLSFSPDGRLLAVGGELGAVSVFEMDTGSLVHDASKVHNQLLLQVEWLPDGKTVATTGADGMVSLYDAKRGLVRASMPGSSIGAQGYTYLLSVTSHEVRAVTGERDGRVYPLTSSKWLDYACVVAGRDLTRDEWSRYLPGRPYRPTCWDRLVAGSSRQPTAVTPGRELGGGTP